MPEDFENFSFNNYDEYEEDFDTTPSGVSSEDQLIADILRKRQEEEGREEAETDTTQTEQPTTDANESEGLTAFKAWATEQGITLDEDKYKDVEWTEDFVKQEMRAVQAHEYLMSKDPTMAALVQQGVSINDYIQQATQLSLVSDDNLVLDSYVEEERHREFQRLHSLGKLKGDAEGNLTPQERQLIEKVADARAKMTYDAHSVEERKEIAQQLRQQALTQMPETIRQQAQERYEAQLAKYNQDRETLVKTLQENVPKSTLANLNKEQQTAVQTEIAKLFELTGEGANQAPKLYQLLQNDIKVLERVVQFVAMNQLGYFEKQQAKANQQVFDKLLKTPNTKGSNNHKEKGGKTTTPVIHTP